MDVSTCPVCSHQSFRSFLQCKDYTVSGEIFNLIECQNCGFVLTSPRPSNAQLEQYYHSDAYISHTGKATNIVDTAYLIARQYTLRWKARLVKKNSNGTAILDYGCGTGEFLSVCKNLWDITGVEPSDIARRKAQKLTGSKNIFKSIEEIENSYDIITLWHVLEHLPDLSKTIDLLKLKLRQSGTMFIAVPNRKSHDAKKYKQHWAGYDVPRHLWHFSQADMNRLLNNHKLTISTIIPMKLDAYYISLISEKYMQGTTSIKTMVKAIYEGAKTNLIAAKSGEYSSLIYIVKK